ncbi:E3 ubiquitin-protein ligase [Sarracenia purpurea var. burkii]
MGLQSQVCDCSSESILILAVAIVATCVSYLRSLVFAILRSAGLSQTNPNDVDDEMFAAMGSGLPGLIILADQMNLNRALSHRYGGDERSSMAGSECVVCLSGLREGEQVRRLACRHVFHKDCFEAWLHHLNFSCPLCRHSLVSGERVAATERRVSYDLLTFFFFR